MELEKIRQLFSKIREAKDYYEDEKYTQAYSILSSIEKESTYPELRYKVLGMKTECLMRAGNMEAAEEQIERNLTENPLDATVTFVAAEYYDRTDVPGKADRYFLRAVIMKPKKVSFALRYSSFLRRRHDYRKATGILIRALRFNRTDYLAENEALLFIYLELAHLYYAQQKYRRAAILYEHVGRNLENFVYYDQISSCYLRLKDYPKALEYSKLNLELWGENDSESLFIHAKALAGMGSMKEAVHYLEMAGKKRGRLGETLVISTTDLRYFAPLLRDGSIHRIQNLFIDF